jgi:hypothetical protein
MKKILLVILSAVLLFCSCSKADSGSTGSVALSETASYSDTVIPDIKITDKKLDFSSCLQLSDALLLFYD